MLALLGTWRGDDAALRPVLGLSTDALDAALQEWIRDEFPTAVTRIAPPSKPTPR